MLKQVSLYGSTGFIGSNFSKLESLQIDKVDRNNPDPMFKDVLYTIGTTDNYNIFENPKLDIETNLIKLIDDLEILRQKFGTFTFNYLSSWFVYGDSKPLPYSVSNNCNPRGFYSISKFAAEKFLISYCSTYKINYRILRLSNIYGINDKGVSAKKNALQFLINRIKSNEKIELYEGGNFLRDYLDVRDAVSAINLVVNNGELDKIYNVGSGKPTLFIDLMTKAKEIFNSNSEFTHIKTPEFHRIVQVKDAYLDISDLSDLGFVPKYDIMHEIINL
jgi:nucleoside-diphosphate-sugar epimerase